MQKIKSSLLVCFTAFFLISCSADITDYEPKKQNFDIKTYFTGKVIARGMIQDYSDKVTRRFCVELNGTWQDNNGVLAEKFYYNDGEISFRNWQLTKLADGSYEGQAEDVVGTAIGKHQGFAFQFQYELLLEVDDDTYQVTMDDWMYQIDKYRVMNTTEISKLGVNIAKVTLFFDKQTAIQECLSDDNI